MQQSRIKARQFWKNWKSEIAPKLEKEVGKNYRFYSNDKKWTKIVSRVIKKTKMGLTNLQLRPEDFKIDFVFSGKENLIYSEKYFYPKERLILLEHENKINKSYDELYKLLYMRSPLKVIITYQYEDGKIKDLNKKIKVFADKISESNKWFKDNKSTEYLFIIGRRNKSNSGIWWFAFIINTKGKIIPLHSFSF